VIVTNIPAGTVKVCGAPVKVKVWLTGAAARGPLR
jgi:hypothetical protein